MGRIADALKRAEEERRRTMGAAGVSAGTALLETPAPPRRMPEGGHIRTPKEEGDDPEAVSLVEGISDSLLPMLEGGALVTEQYRSLRTRLLSQNPNYEHRIVAITSAIPKEGKSVTTLNLGSILAEIKHLKVLVVDGDFRRSSLARMLNQPEGPGLAEVLRGEAAYDEVQRSTPISNLTFIPAGEIHTHSAAELLTAASASSIFKRMQNDFHYTIVDTPPATTVTDVGIIGQMCSGVILVIRLHRTAEGAAKRAARLLQVNNIPTIGCVIIGRDAPSGRYGYSYGYEYGYSYRYHRYYNEYKDAGD